jgi:hypothetical protein
MFNFFLQDSGIKVTDSKELGHIQFETVHDQEHERTKQIIRKSIMLKELIKVTNKPFSGINIVGQVYQHFDSMYDFTRVMCVTHIEELCNHEHYEHRDLDDTDLFLAMILGN